MHLRYYTNEKGERIYTLKTILDDGSYTLNAHPGNFKLKIVKFIKKIICKLNIYK